METELGMAPASKHSLKYSVHGASPHCGGVVTNPVQDRTLINQHSHQKLSLWTVPAILAHR